eukprot:TRINITY_DN10192_c0_g1_i4.p2 TRINITY_DN10192_c0_g1~~TRINITY_DN10192_c0_g1_i4.p2  ORF type:complete len:146 (-),score=35.49 TRINITY_DN10192_c0_g1_i4:99-536(-)
MWSLGILLYEMLHGFPPFKGKVRRDTISKILGNRLRFARGIKEDARDVMEVILNLDSKERPTVCQILDSPWGRRMAVELNSPLLIFSNTERQSDENENTCDTPSNSKGMEEEGGVLNEVENKIWNVEVNERKEEIGGVAYKRRMD